MKRHKHSHIKAQIRHLRRQLKEERASNNERAVYDRQVINDLHHRLHAATIEKNTEMDGLIGKLSAAAKAMAEQAREERATLCNVLHIEL